MPRGIHSTSGVLIRGEGMDRNGMKKYILFSSQNILVTKTCHPAPFSLTRTLRPPIIWEERTQKKLEFWNFQWHESHMGFGQRQKVPHGQSQSWEVLRGNWSYLLSHPNRTQDSYRLGLWLQPVFSQWDFMVSPKYAVSLSGGQNPTRYIFLSRSGTITPSHCHVGTYPSQGSL